MSSPIRKLAAILAADAAGYRVPVMHVMGQKPLLCFSYNMVRFRV